MSSAQKFTAAASAEVPPAPEQETPLEALDILHTYARRANTDIVTSHNDEMDRLMRIVAAALSCPTVTVGGEAVGKQWRHRNTVHGGWSKWNDGSVPTEFRQEQHEERDVYAAPPVDTVSMGGFPDPNAPIRADLEALIQKFEDGNNHDLGAYDADCPTCRILEELRSLVSRDYDRYDQPTVTAAAETRPLTDWLGPPFVFDRYINGRLMAEGVRIERQDTLAAAILSAGKLAARGPRGEVPVLVLKSAVSVDGGVSADAQPDQALRDTQKPTEERG